MAVRLGTRSVTPDHMFLAILAQRNSMAVNALTSLGVDPLHAATDIQLTLQAQATPPVESEGLTSLSEKVLDFALGLGKRAKIRKLGPEHLLLAILKVEGLVCTNYLADHGVGFKQLKKVLEIPSTDAPPSALLTTLTLKNFLQSILTEQPSVVREKIVEFKSGPIIDRDALTSLSKCMPTGTQLARLVALLRDKKPVQADALTDQDIAALRAEITNYLLSRKRTS